MGEPATRPLPLASVVHWIARLTAALVVVPLLLILVGESGSGPAGVREWVYLALFPVAFSIGYLLGWRWPLLGGGLSLACMAASLLVIGRTFPPRAYLVWAVLSLPGLLYLVAGWMLPAAPRADAATRGS